MQNTDLIALVSCQVQRLAARVSQHPAPPLKRLRTESVYIDPWRTLYVDYAHHSGEYRLKVISGTDSFRALLTADTAAALSYAPTATVMAELAEFLEHHRLSCPDL